MSTKSNGTGQSLHDVLLPLEGLAPRNVTIAINAGITLAFLERGLGRHPLLVQPRPSVLVQDNLSNSNSKASLYGSLSRPRRAKAPDRALRVALTLQKNTAAGSQSGRVGQLGAT